MSLDIVYENNKFNVSQPAQQHTAKLKDTALPYIESTLRIASVVDDVTHINKTPLI